MIDLAAAFDAVSEEAYQFDRIGNPRHPRPDLCAFLLLHELVPGTDNMISASEHDEYYLSIDCDQLAKVATAEDVLLLRRCGVRYKVGLNSLVLFA